MVSYDLKKGRGYYKLLNNYDGNALDVENAGTANGTNVQKYIYNGSDAQLWDLIGNGNGYYLLVSKNSNKFLDVSSGLTDDGTNVQIYERNHTQAQSWLLVGQN